MRKNFPVGESDEDSYENFDKLIEYLNDAWKKAKEFIKNETNS